MITAIKQIGDFLNNKDILKSLVLRNAKFDYLIIVNFDTTSKTVQFKTEECSPEKLDEYLWIGHFRPKFHAVTCKYEDITGIINDYCDENKLKKNGRIKLQCYKNLKDKFSKIKDIEIIDPTHKGLFMISIDNELLCKNSDYLEVLHYEKINKYFFEENIKLCSLCGNKVNSTSERYPFKFYNQDKKGFSSGLKGDFSNNYTICESCLEKSYQGQAFIENNLISNIGKLKLYIIPHFVCFNKEQIKIERFVNPLKNIYNPAANISAMANFDERLKQFLKFDMKSKAS
ncbi:MAG: TM1802 family CRISPR-associated protein, partial [Candidatus Delongbacteria bacterium]|nr:TM1802 family CRISPR-associated protein [Candidatus Delongbacteria bacterium]